jgi:hypothetical protein
MTDIKKLLNKYYKPDGENMTADVKINPAERFSNKYHNTIRQEQKNKHRYLLLQQLLNETPFYLNEDQIQQIQYWIDTFNDNFKEFHRQASEETIILALIFIQRKQTHKDTQIYRYKISSKYNLTTPVFTTIQNQLIFQLMRTTPLTYSQKKHLDNHILQKRGRE